MQRARTQFARTLVVILAVVAVFAGPPLTSSQATPYNGKCEANEVCVYKDANLGAYYSDFLYAYEDYGGCPDCHTYNSPSSCNTYKSALCLLNDSISSMDSWSERRKVRFFTSAHWDGSSQTLATLERVNQARYNDAYSSHCWSDGGVSSSTDPDCTF